MGYVGIEVHVRLVYWLVYGVEVGIEAVEELMQGSR